MIPSSANRLPPLSNTVYQASGIVIITAQVTGPETLDLMYRYATGAGVRIEDVAISILTEKLTLPAAGSDLGRAEADSESDGPVVHP